MGQAKTSPREMPSASWRARLWRELLVLLAFCLLTAVMTWPWVLHLRNAVADVGDPYMIAWALWWDFHQTFSDPLHLFDANVFYPYHYTLAFSEHDYGISLLFFPLFALGVRPLTVHSVATFLGFAFCGYGAFRLTRTLTGSRGAAWVAGFVFAFIPYRFHGLGHLHYLFAGWMPLLLEALVLFALVRSRRRAAWLGAAFLMNGLTCITWMILTLVPLALTGLLLLARDPALRRDRAFWQRGAVALGAAALLLLPFLLPYYRVTVKYGLKWQDWDFAAKSPPVMSWLAADRRSKLWAGLGEQLPGGHKLFPGVLAPLLALSALRVRGTASALLLRLRGRRASEPQSGGPHEGVGVGLVWTLWGFLASLGANFFPNTLMHHYLLPYRSIHIPSRSAMVCYVGLAVLAGVGAARLARAAARSSPRVYAAVLAAVLAGLTFDLRAFPLQFERGAVYPDAVTLRLKETPMRGGLVELPSNGCCLRHRYMLRAADHGRPLVNATSSFISPLTEQINRLSNDSPIPASFLELLESTPASYLVVHNEDVSPLRREDYRSFLANAVAAKRLRFVNRFDNRDDLYAVVKTEPDARAEAPPPTELEARDWATLIEEDPVNLLTGNAEWGRALYRLHLVARGRMPRYAEFRADARTAGLGLFPGSLSSRLEFDARLAALARSWEGRGWFVEAYGRLDDAQYVARLYGNAGIEATPAERTALAEALASRAETRAGALLKVAVDPRLEERGYNRSLLLLHYFGFLRRNPNDAPDRDLEGFDFWLSNLERVGELDQITLAFRDSFEYKRIREGNK
ncbi:MAG TPA: hypothetical protein VGW76_21785 [Pyrinomonadaceae bacterium]|nr:hypothetical protein [Pyrinomonadaceae bacterium]